MPDEERFESAEDRWVYRPAPLPDNRKMVWYPPAVCGAVSAVGFLMGNLPLGVVPLIVLAVFPGIPIAIHSVFFLSVKITLNGDRLVVIDWAGDPFVRYPRRQEIALSQVTYVYHLEKEIREHDTGAAPFDKTCVKIEKYRAANKDTRRLGAVARTDNGLVLSDDAGDNKVYIMHFHDLAKGDWQTLARRIQRANAGISFLMSEDEKRGLLGEKA